MVGKKINAIGFTSKTEDGLHIIIGDIDKKNFPVYNILNILKNFQFKYNLSSIYIIESRSGFNFVCLKKFDFKKVVYMLQTLDIIDEKFLKCSIERGYFTLRIGNDKKVIAIIHNYEHNIKNSLSNIHRIILIDFFNAYSTHDCFNDDNNKKIEFVRYIDNYAKKKL